MDENDLVERIHAGDNEAWDELVRRYERLVYALPARLGLGQADVEEVFQNTWLLLYEHLRGIRDPRRLRAWIATTATRESWRILRARRGAANIDGLELAGAESEPNQTLEELELRNEILLALESLRPLCRRLIEKLFFDAHKPAYESVARSLEIPIGSLGPTRARCLADLGRQLEKRGLAGPDSPA